tara:strand:- start:107 stop:1162 length:1056 start_codon:yes stop_codon:yes gene_type:complete
MKSSEFIKKIKTYAVIAFLLPLLTINSCLLLFKLLGNIDLYPNLDWNNKKVEVPLYSEKFKSSSFIDCPANSYTKYLVTVDDKTIEVGHVLSNGDIKYVQENIEIINKLTKNNKIKSEIFQQDESINYRCVKNYKILYTVLNNFSFLENVLIDIKSANPSVFSSIKNPYFYGEVSISRTARYFPATLIFKPFIILSAIFLLLYWRNNLGLFNELKNNNILNNFSKNFYYFGVLSCLFLILHAAFLGLDFDSKLFSKLRRLIIISFIFFELCAQILLTKNLFNYRDQLKEHTRLLVIKVKVVFVVLAIFSTLIIFALLAWGDLNTNMKHVFEWNYFSALLVYYFLSRILWRN